MEINPVRGPVYRLLLALSLVLTVAAILTLVPWPDARWPNILGYKSLCPFAPAATFACALLAGLTCVVRSRLLSARAAAHRPPIVPVLLALVFLGVGIPSVVVWAGYKTDATASASTP